MERDLTVGSVPKQLFIFSIPLFLTNILQSLYSIADMIIVGQFTGSTGLAAISSASMLSFLITSICTGITMGGTVLIAQYKGNQNRQGQAETAGTLFSVSAIAALLVTALSLLLYPHVFRWMNVPPDSMSEALSYMKIICLGTVFVFGYNGVCAVMRGLGDSRSPLFFVAIAAFINVLLDLLFVGAMGLGTPGAALATVIAQGGSFAIAASHLKRKQYAFDFKLSSLRIHGDKCKIILKIGLPAAGQMVIVNLSYLLVTGMLNVYGVAVAAAAGIGLKVNTFAAMPCWAVGQAVTTMTAQNMGAENEPRVIQTAKSGICLALSASLVMMIAIQLFAEPIISLFISGEKDPEVIHQGILYLRICCSLNFTLYAVMYIFDSFATGVGSSTFAMMNAILHSFIMRILLSLLFGTALGGGFVGLYWAECIAPALSALLGTAFFLRGGWKKRKLID